VFFGFVFYVFFYVSLSHLGRIACFRCVGFRDWLGRTSLKWPILCRVGWFNALTQSATVLTVAACFAVMVLLLERARPFLTRVWW